MPRFDCTTFQPEMTIYKQCCTCCKPPCDDHCPPCSPCNSIDCDCVAQIKNIITQLLARLPAGTALTFYTGTTTAFTANIPHISLTGVNTDVLVLRTDADVFYAAIPVCDIQQISVLTTALAGITLTYLAPPICPTINCKARCEADLRALISTLGTTTSYNVQTNNFVVNAGPIIQNQYGLITQTEGTLTNFISTCDISAIYAV